MASMTMTASFLGGSVAGSVSKLPATTTRRGVVAAKASKVDAVPEGEKVVMNNKEESNNGRRELVFAAAAAAAWSLAKIAVEEEEPERGTPEAKKKYAAVCVTMPTARICRK